MGLNIGRGMARLALAATIAAASVVAMAQENALKVKLKLKDAELVSATRSLTSQTGVQFVFEASTEPYGKITMEVADVSPEDAVRYICQAAGAVFRRDERGVFVIGHRHPEAPPAPSPVAGDGAVRVLRKIKVLKADAGDVADMLRYQKVFSDTRGFERIKHFNEVTRDDNRVFGMTPHFTANGFTENYQPVGASPVKTPALAGSETSGQIAIPGSESAGQFAAGGGQAGIGGGGGGFGAGGQGTPGGGGQGGGASRLQGGQGLVPEGIDFISYDPTDNSIVVNGTEEAIQKLQDAIALFDRVPQQVLIKVEFITTTETVDRSFGTEFLYQRGTVFAGTRPGSFVRAGDPVFLNYASGNITGRLRASLVEGRGKVVSAPIIRTLNNQPASINATVRQYIFINQLAATGNVVVNVPQAIPLDASTNLSVAPRINDDNTITLFLAPNIQAFVGTSVSPDGQQFPNQTFQSINVVARVRNGETMVLGGLTSKSEDNSVNRVPVLSELPVIGQFFRTNNKTKSVSELLIFVTPTIVDEDTTGSPGQNTGP